jgi:hypothetical protein
MGLFQNSLYHCQKPYKTEHLVPAEISPHLIYFTIENHGEEGKNAIW